MTNLDFRPAPMTTSHGADHRFDCVVCGSCTVDVLVRGMNLDAPIGVDQLHRVEPIKATVGGIVSNAGISLSRLGMRVAGFSATGDDQWSPLVRGIYKSESISSAHISTHPTMPTSTTVVMIDDAGRRSFVHSQGAPKAMTADDYLAALPLFATSRSMLLGYYPLLPKMIDELAEVMQAIQATGCLTAMDSAGGGGTMHPLVDVLPHIDVYCPSLQEATTQTGRTEPEDILKTYRDAGAAGIIGVKLGSRGAMLSPSGDQKIKILPVEPPGKVVDTTGAGDAFFAGLIAGTLSGMKLEDAGRLAAAAGAISTTAAGATTAATSMAELKRLAGIS